MPCAFLQRAAVRAVVNRQTDVQFGNFQLSHDAALVDGENLIVLLLRRGQAGQRIHSISQNRYRR